MNGTLIPAEDLHPRKRVEVLDSDMASEPIEGSFISCCSTSTAPIDPRRNAGITASPLSSAASSHLALPPAPGDDAAQGDDAAGSARSSPIDDPGRSGPSTKAT